MTLFLVFITAILHVSNTVALKVQYTIFRDENGTGGGHKKEKDPDGSFRQSLFRNPGSIDPDLIQTVPQRLVNIRIIYGEPRVFLQPVVLLLHTPPLKQILYSGK